MSFIFKRTNINIDYSNLSKYTNIKIIDWAIPISFFNINSNNNIFYINDGADKTVTLTLGDYRPSTLIVEIQTKLNAISTNFTVTFNNDTNKITITRTSNFNLLFNSYSNFNQICDVIGFNKTDHLAASTYTSENIFNGRPYNIIMIRSNELSISNNIKKVNNTNNPRSCQFYINLRNYEFGNIANPENSSINPKEMKLTDDLSNQTSINFTYYFLTDNGKENIVDFNGQEPILIFKFTNYRQVMETEILKALAKKQLLKKY